MLNVKQLKKYNSLPDEPGFIVTFEGKEQPIRISADLLKEFLGVDYTTEVVEINSADILTLGASPVSLLPVPGAGNYYDIEKIIFEYTHVTTAYAVTDVLRLNLATDWLYVSTGLITQSSNQVVVMYPSGAFAEDTGNTAQALAVATNAGLTLDTYDGTDPTLGDGTLKVIIRYKVRTFGE